MKKLIYVLLSAFLLPGIPAHSQTPTAKRMLETNNVRARILNGGDMFYDPGTFNSGFEVPKDSMRNTLSGGALWIGGLDAGKNLHLAAMTYRQGGFDYFPGPLDTTTGSTNATTVEDWDSIWTITRTEVEAFKVGGPITTNIARWPAQSSNPNHTHKLAPFIDVDHNGLYEPGKGDYPDVHGNQMMYWVMNDQFNIHTESGGQKLGIEVHATAFALDTTAGNALDNTIYFEYRIINRSQNAYDSLYYGFFADFDIGLPFDDFLGCNPDLNAFFGYNGDTFDDGTYGYGSNPPVQSIAFIGQPLAHFMAYSNAFNNIGNPLGTIDYYNYLRGRWIDGSVLTEGGNGYHGTKPTDLAYPGDPKNAAEWSEVSAHHQPGDRRGVGSVGPFRFAPGDELRLVVAVVYHPNSSGDPLGPFTRLGPDIQQVVDYYKNNFASGISRHDLTAKVLLYPNPAKEIIRVKSDFQIQQLLVMDVLGRELSATTAVENNQAELNIAGFAPGLYFLQIQTVQGIVVKRWVKE